MVGDENYDVGVTQSFRRELFALLFERTTLLAGLGLLRRDKTRRLTKLRAVA